MKAKRKAKQLKLGIAAIVCIIAISAMAVPATANYAFDGWAPTTRTDGTINGTVFVDSVGWNGQTTLTGNFNVPGGTVRRAYLYTGIWGGNPSNTGWVNVTFNNNHTANGLGPIHLQGENDNNANVWCTGYGKYWWWYNVTNLTNAGQTNTATTSEINGTLDGRVYGIVLVVVLENNSLHPIQYWVNDGSYALHYATGGHPATNTHTTNFAGSVDTGNVSYAELAAVYLTGYSPQCNKCTKFNGHLLDTSDITTNTFFLKTFGAGSNVTAENVTSSGNNAWFTRCNDYSTCSAEQSDPFVNICNAILTLNDTADDLIVTDIDVGTPRPNNDFTVKATVKNEGSNSVGHFNVSLFVNGSFYAKNTSISGLNAGASTTVSFYPVNLPKDCHSFRVFADSDSDISEDIETNNNMTVNGQVGYVIVVESYSDFDSLVTESNDGLLGAGNVSHSGDTYYIKNFTGSSAIENCAGNGITIKNLNTSTKLVIKNCTIKNCTYSGVKFHNLSNGTIENSTVPNNTKYGIEVGEVPLGSDDPNYVTIKNNTISDTEIDISLIALNSTVINNTIHNNIHAIYLYGNDSNITGNILKNNTGYAIKAYNSYNNYIYENEFIGNNIGNPGHQAYDNRNSNHWNTTTIGNYWTDWDDNSGAPGNYSIDGDSNKDYEPRGLFVFGCNAGTDKWAFRNQTLGNSASDPNIEFTEAQYAKITEDDEVRQEDQTSLDTYYAAHRFNISINSSLTSGIDTINVTWIGKGRHDTLTHGAKLRIWNSSLGASGAYKQLNTTTDGDWVTLTGGVTSNIFTDYINANNVTILVNQTSAQIYDEETEVYRRSHIWTDYIKLVITPE